MSTGLSERYDETALLEAVRQGDPCSISEFYDRHLNRVYNFIYHRVGRCVEDAEDVTQETFIAALRSLGRFRGECSVYTWLCGIAKNKVRDFIRRQHRASEAPAAQRVDADDPDELDRLLSSEWQMPVADAVVSQACAKAIIDTVFGMMTADERDVLWLRYVDELSTREIAAVLGRTEKAIEGLLSRARKKAARYTATGAGMGRAMETGD